MGLVFGTTFGAAFREPPFHVFRCSGDDPDMLTGHRGEQHLDAVELEASLLLSSHEPPVQLLPIPSASLLGLSAAP